MATVDGANVKKVIIACDAGMGSSVMLASNVRKQLASKGVTVEHSPVAEIPADADVVLTNASLAERARATQPNVPVVPFKMFIGDPAVTKVVNAIKNGQSINV